MNEESVRGGQRRGELQINVSNVQFRTSKKVLSVRDDLAMKTCSVSVLVVIFGTSADQSPIPSHGFLNRQHFFRGQLLVGSSEVDFFLTVLKKVGQTRSDSNLICKGFCSRIDFSCLE